MIPTFSDDERNPMILTRPLCLASTSPRRRDILEQFGLSFEVFAPQVHEEVVPGESPEEHVLRLAQAKVLAAASHYPSHVILAGDTVVAHDQEILGKPADEEDAVRMIRALSGRAHKVFSGYVVAEGPEGARCEKVVETAVVFRALPDDWIQWYVRQDESRDKAGAYGIQGLGGAMVERIEGSYTNVVGMPIEHIIWDMIDKGWIAL